MITGENPWRTLRARPHLTLHTAQLPDGVRGLWTPGHIVLDPRLTRTERRCTLMHELIHDERGITSPDPAVMAREEATVRRLTAERLVPVDALAGWVVRRIEVEPVTAWCVAEAADVTVEVAVDALRLLHPSRAYRASDAHR